MATLTLDGQSIHYVDYDASDTSNGPPMLLVHGLGGSHVNWRAVGPKLAQHRRVVAIDLPGFGRTPLAARDKPLERNAELISRFIDRQLGGRAILVGNSMGGLLSLMVASESSQRVPALVLVDAALPPAPGVRPDREVVMVFAMYMIPRLGEWIMKSRAAKLSPEQLVRETMRVCAAEPDKLPRDIIEAHVAIAEERRAMAWAHDAFLGSARGIVRSLVVPFKLQRAADRITSPTLVIHGDRDRLVPVGLARAAAKRRRWHLEIFEGVGHVPQLEVPDRFVRAVESFLAHLPN